MEEQALWPRSQSDLLNQNVSRQYKKPDVSNSVACILRHSPQLVLICSSATGAMHWDSHAAVVVMKKVVEPVLYSTRYCSRTSRKWQYRVVV